MKRYGIATELSDSKLAYMLKPIILRVRKNNINMHLDTSCCNFDEQCLHQHFVQQKFI
jgi:hypothetical protein